jgi:hypothetical protein
MDISTGLGIGAIVIGAALVIFPINIFTREKRMIAGSVLFLIGFCFITSPFLLPNTKNSNDAKHSPWVINGLHTSHFYEFYHGPASEIPTMNDVTADHYHTFFDITDAPAQDRHLSEKTEKRLTDYTDYCSKKFPGKTIEIEVANDTEAENFSKEVQNYLNSKGINSEIDAYHSVPDSIPGQICAKDAPAIIIGKKEK